MKIWREAAILVVVVGFLTPSASSEGVLNVGTPSVNGSTITVPVYLEGDVDSGVAALDFTLRYDPSILAPNGVRAAEAAIAADKGVQYNMTSPGNYVVMMFGLNQATMSNGRIADITLRQVGTAAGNTNISIDGTTLASIEGQTIASRGSSATLQLGAPPSDDPDPVEPDSPPDTEPDTEPTPPDDSEPPVLPTEDTNPPPAAEPTDSAPSVSNPRLPAVPALGTDSEVSNGTADAGRSPGPRSLRSPGSDNADSRLSQLDRMAREFERRRSGLPTPVQDDAAPNSAPATSAATQNNSTDSRAGDSASSTRPLLGNEANGEVGQMASLAPAQTASSTAKNLPASASQPVADAARRFFADPRLWILGILAVVFTVGILLRKRLLS